MFKYIISAIVGLQSLYGAIVLTNLSQLPSASSPGTNALLYLVKVTTNGGNLVYTPFKLTPSLTNIESLVGGPLRYIITAGTNIVIGTNGNVITINTPGGSGANLPGTMINNGTSGVGWVSIYTNATGTQLVASASLYLTNGTNVVISGGIVANNFTGSGDVTVSAIDLPNDAGTFYFGFQAYDTASANVRLVGPPAPFTAIPFYNNTSSSNVYITNLVIGANLTLTGNTLSASGGGGGASDNWVASGTTNSTLPGNGFAYNLQLTNGLTVLNPSGPATLMWFDQASGDTIGYRVTASATMTTNINMIPPPAPLADGSLLMWKNRGSTTNEYLTNAIAGTDYAAANASITVTGTANQVNVSGSPVALGGTVILSTPQNIATASSPTFAGLTLTGAETAPSAVLTNSLKLLNATASKPARIGADQTVTNGVITETDISLSDITTDNVSTSAHGFAPKLPNDATLFLNGIGGYTAPASGSALANTVLGSGTTVANDIAVFTDTTHTNIARSTSAGRMGDNSSSTYTLTIDLSGTDAVFTFGSALATFSGTWDINQGTSDAAIFKGRGGTVTSSGTTTLYDLSGTWNTSGTPTLIRGYVTNTASGSAGACFLIDLGINTSTSEFKVDRNGSITAAGGITCGSVTSSGNVQAAASSNVQFQGRGGMASTADGVFLLKDTAGTGFTSLTLGPSDSSPNNAELKTPDGSGTDIAGGILSVEGGKSTGTGRGGDVIIKTTTSSTTGSSANSYSERAHYSAKTVTLTESSATLFANISVASSKFAGANLTCTINANDGTDFQSLTSTVRVDAVNKAGTVTATLTQTDNTTAASSGTLTCTYTAVANGAGVDIKANAVSSLTQTVLNCTWAIVGLNSDGVATVTVQ